MDGPESRGRYLREVTALRAAAQADPPVVPRLLGVDPDQRVLVMEYLDDRPPAGDDWVVGWAAALARLHATGIAGGVAGGVESLPRWSGPSLADVGSFLGLAGALGVAVSAGARDELEGVVARLGSAPGPALLHGDPCPDNARHTPDGVRFIDFEHCGRGDGRLELAYLRIGWPTCWCALAPARPLVEAAEAAYRAAWQSATGRDLAGGPAAGGPAAGGPVGGPADLADACVGWLLRGDGLVEWALRGSGDHLGRLLERDWTWGVATARQRLLHRLLVVAQLAKAGGSLEGVGRMVSDMAARVSGRWPGLGPLPPTWRWWEGLDGG